MLDLTDVYVTESLCHSVAELGMWDNIIAFIFGKKKHGGKVNAVKSKELTLKI